MYPLITSSEIVTQWLFATNRERSPTADTEYGETYLVPLLSGALGYYYKNAGSAGVVVSVKPHMNLKLKILRRGRIHVSLRQKIGRYEDAAVVAGDKEGFGWRYIRNGAVRFERYWEWTDSGTTEVTNILRWFFADWVYYGDIIELEPYVKLTQAGDKPNLKLYADADVKDSVYKVLYVPLDEAEA